MARFSSLLLGLFAATGARAWVPLALDDARALETALRWSAPAPAAAGSSAENDGLGGGLTYAIEPTFCERILPNIRDDLFADAGALVRCELLKAAVARAFSAWEVNHKEIHFVDAGAEACAPRADGGLEPETADGNGGRCIVPEILVRAPRAGDAGFNESAFGDKYDAQVRAGYTEVVGLSGQGVLKTNGVLDLSGGRIVRARVSVNTKMCWYLDAPFCFGFRARPSGDGRGVSNSTLLVCAWVCAGALALAWLAYLVYAAMRPRRRRASRCASWLACACVGLLLVWPPVFARIVFAPCLDCLDFEQMLTHEIGHALGLGHPDEAAATGLNYRLPRGRDLDARGVCRDDLRLPERTSAVAPSLLLATVQHTAGACPSRDDVEGLHVLYPTCSDSLFAEPRCPAPSARSTGILRTLWAVGIALAASAAFATALAAIVGRLGRATDEAATFAQAADGAADRTAHADGLAPRGGDRRGSKVDAMPGHAHDATPPLLRCGAVADAQRSDAHSHSERRGPAAHEMQHARSSLGVHAAAPMARYVKPPPPARVVTFAVAADPPALVLRPSQPPPTPPVGPGGWLMAVLAEVGFIGAPRAETGSTPPTAGRDSNAGV
jgi:hypothetical protein